jgi:hypothetical protein
MNYGEKKFHKVNALVKDRENVDVVILIEELLEDTDYIFAVVASMKSGLT